MRIYRFFVQATLSRPLDFDELIHLNHRLPWGAAVNVTLDPLNNDLLPVPNVEQPVGHVYSLVDGPTAQWATSALCDTIREITMTDADDGYIVNSRARRSHSVEDAMPNLPVVQQLLAARMAAAKAATETKPAFVCPACERITTHPNDVMNGYCPHCKWFTGVEPMLASLFPDIWTRHGKTPPAEREATT